MGGGLRAGRGPTLGWGFSFFPKHIGVNFGWGAHSLSPAGYSLGLLFGVVDCLPMNEDLSQDNLAVQVWDMGLWEV